MKKTQYILRFDDICPTMKWSIWNQIVDLLDKYQIKPIIAVIPNNHDQELMCEPSNPHYWDWLRERQSKGWKIALHGYEHFYVNKDCGILGINDYSEFAGVDKETQMRKLEEGLKILRDHGINCDTWIAPAHSFDINTLECLKKVGIRIVSDGYSRLWFWRNGLLWIPCQLYKFCPQKNGVWTVCKHPSMWNQNDLNSFVREIDEWKEKIVPFDEVVSQATKSPSKGRLCSLESSFVCMKNRCKRKLKCSIMSLRRIRPKDLLVKVYRLCRGDAIKKARSKAVAIGEKCRLNDTPRWGSEPWLISLGNHVELSLNVTFLTHDGSTWCFRDAERYKNVIKYGKIEIGDNSFIGANVTILPGVTIGPNSIVGAASVVTKNVEPNSVYAGVPARRICSIEEYAEKCLAETPDYDLEAYRKDKKKEVLRMLEK